MTFTTARWLLVLASLSLTLSDSSLVATALSHQNRRQRHKIPQFLSDSKQFARTNDDEIDDTQSSRRTMLRVGGLSTTMMLASWLLPGAILPDSSSPLKCAAHAFDRAYPSELQAPSDEALDSRARSLQKIRRKEARRASNVLVETPVLSSFVWGSALWFLSGSRSNPIATPLANIIYNATQETWLQDRNDGLFASLPWEYLIILTFVFAALGFGADALVSAIAEGDRVISLQLAGVSLIAGCSLELGRIASGSKKQTRQESDRSVQLEAEFTRFANERLVPGGNCHRNEVVQAFRRYYAKYRQANSVEYPLTDLEIEQLLRAYCRPRGLDMSSAGFYTGVQINQDADAFAKKI
jgi:hypothetical protein